MTSRILNSELSKFFRTTFPSSKFVLNWECVKRIFSGQYGTSGPVYLSENRVISPEILLKAFIKEQLKTGIPFDLRVSRESFMHLSICAQELFATLSIREFDNIHNQKLTPHIRTIYLESPGKLISFDGIRIENLTVSGNFNGALIINNCKIKSLNIREYYGQTNRHIMISDTWINTFRLESNCAKDVQIVNGGIKGFLAPLPTSRSPIIGDFSLKGLPIMGFEEGLNLVGSIQHFRNLRLHLKGLENSNAEHYLFAIEKRIERSEEKYPIKAISYLYDLFAFYGERPLRSIYWLLGIIAFSAVFFATFQLSAVPYSCVVNEEDLVGWKLLLCEPGMLGDLVRGLSLSIQNVFNPAGIFRESLVTASNFPTLIFSIFQSLFSIILLAIGVFGLRKKFKMN